MAAKPASSAPIFARPWRGSASSRGITSMKAT
jgi:hypothetical protein